MLTSVLAVVIGLVLLVIAADRLVVSAVRVSSALGISAILVGALIVGLGTSLPELLVSAFAGVDDEVDVAMANVVGSNITNVTLVLGTAAIVGSVRLRRRTLRREGVLMLISVVALALVLADSQVESWEGWLLLVGMIAAMYFLIRWSTSDSENPAGIDQDAPPAMDAGGRSVGVDVLFGVVALAVTIFAADLLLNGALDLGAELGLGDAFLGVLLGVGTSIPELATALASVRRRESDLVVGNVIGSNLFNSLAVAGTGATLGSGPLQDLDSTALWVMIGSVLLAGLMSRTGGRLARGEGIVLLGVFATFLFLAY